MTKIIDVLAKNNGRGIHHFRYGYAKAPLTLMLFYDLSSLNDPNFDFNKAKVKHAKIEKTKFADATKVIWYEDSIKEKDFTATADSATTEFEASINTLQVGDQIRNKTTGEVMLVVDVDGTTVTVDVNVKGISEDDEFIRRGFAKTYGQYSARGIQFNDYIPYDNYIQFVSAEIPSDKTDVLTNNLDRLFYPTTNDYLKELYVEASRVIVKTMIYSLYAGVSQAYTLPSGKKIYTAGGLEFYIPASALDRNIYDASAKNVLLNLQAEIAAAYKSGVDGIQEANRLMFFVNYKMSSDLTSVFLDLDNVQQSENSTFEKFGINIKSLNLNGYKLNIVEDYVLDDLYGTEAVGFMVDIQSIILYNLQDGVINTDGKTVSALGVSSLFSPAQTTYEIREVSLNTNFTWVFKNISSGAFRKIIYKSK